MKDLLFEVLVVALTPIYLIISIVKFIIFVSKKMGEWMLDIFIEPIIDGILILFGDMLNFWEKIIKRNSKKEQETQQINNKINETIDDLMDHKITPNQAREKFGLPRIEGKNDN